MTYSENALGDYLNFSAAKSSLSAKEKEAVSLAVSEVNGCEYCLSAHTAIAKMNAYSDAEVIELRKGHASFDSKLDVLAKLSKNIVESKGDIDAEVLKSFFNAGWTKANLVDTVSLIGVMTISNYLNNITKIAIDFPVAPKL